MRISDWSSDVCSSDLYGRLQAEPHLRHGGSLEESPRFASWRTPAQHTRRPVSAVSGRAALRIYQFSFHVVRAGLARPYRAAPSKPWGDRPGDHRAPDHDATRGVWVRPVLH